MIDEAVVDLMQWIESKGNEREIGKVEGKQPGKGQTWVPKYSSIADILAEYGGHDDEPEALIPEADIDALIAELDQDMQPAF